ncbi:MAG: trigger factor [Acholeplasmatales bacterium]|nr:trigger factor [Acholeplasmatales bacterium]
MATIEKMEKSLVKIIIDVTPEEFEEGLNKAFDKKKKDVTIPGFRKGQITRAQFEKKFGVESLYEEAIYAIADKKYGEAVQENQLFVVGDPQLADLNEIERGKEFKFSIIVPVYPEFEVKNFKGLKGKKMVLEATDEEINAEIEALREQNVLVTPKENGAIEEHDIAVFDFKGMKDGVAFEGGTAENYELEIGSKQFIPGFEDQMIGMKQGEEKTINVTFPSEYQATDLAGKEVQFALKLHEIKRKELPEVNDDFVKDLNKENINTVEELKASIKKDIEKNKEQNEKNRLADELIEQLSNSIEIEIPQAMVDASVKDELKDFERTVNQQYGMKMEEFKKIAQVNEEEFMKNVTERASKKLKETLILEQIVKQEKLTATPEEINKSLEDIAAANNMKVEDVKKYVNPADIAFNVSINKVIDLLIANANLE